MSVGFLGVKGIEFRVQCSVLQGGVSRSWVSRCICMAYILTNFEPCSPSRSKSRRDIQRRIYGFGELMYSVFGIIKLKGSNLNPKA